MVELKNYEMFMDGGYSSLNPDFGNYVGYRFPGGAGQLSSPTSIQTANQLSEVVSRIKEGVKNVELQPIQADTFDQIPKENFKEIKALMKLSGVKPSVHAPMIDPAGFGEKGGYDGEAGREDAERRLFSVIEKSHDLDSEGNIPIVIHSSGGLPGMEHRPDEDKEPGEEGRFKSWKGAAIDRETGKMAGLKEDKLFSPTHPEDLEKGGTVMTPEDQVKTINQNQWEDKLTNLATYAKHAEDIIGNAPLFLAEYKDKEIDKDFLKSMTGEQQAHYEKMRNADIFLENVRLNFSGAFDKAYKYGDEEQREELNKLAEGYKNKLKEVEGKVWQPVETKRILAESVNELQRITRGKAPDVFVEVEDFARDEAAKTFGNLAFKGYKEWGEKAPVLAVENMYQGMAFATADGMKELLKKSKDVFVENAKKKGISESVAKKQADKLLGITWDVGHLNMMRKHGFTEEDVIKETEKVGKLVKHVHLTDNFGYSDSHLPPGMGNVPFKGILEKLEKAGALKNAKAVVEAGGFVQHFKKSPHPYVLQAFGSGVYGAKMAPYWNQVAGVGGNYFSFPMAYLPEKHFSTYGSGFSMLPEELGGQIPGTASRSTGTPMA